MVKWGSCCENDEGLGKLNQNRSIIKNNIIKNRQWKSLDHLLLMGIGESLDIHLKFFEVDAETPEKQTG